MLSFPCIVAQNVYHLLIKKYGTVRGKCHEAVLEELKTFKKAVILSIHDKKHNASHVLLVLNFFGQDYVLDPAGIQYGVKEKCYPLKDLPKHYLIDDYMILSPKNYLSDTEIDKDLYRRVDEFMKSISYRAI